jgi:hypothetical protein
MEDDECESVSEAKVQTMKKKVNVLEAMAKYNLRKQQERELSMKAATKQKPTPPPSPKTTPEKHNYRPKQEYVKTERKETDLGISEYVCKGPGFSAILKQRYSDFQVNQS